MSRTPIRGRDFASIVDEIEGWLPLEEAEYLRLAARSAIGSIVEIGCYRGRSTAALALGALESSGSIQKVYSIDPHDEFTGQLGGAFGPIDRVHYYRNVLRAGVAEHASLINLPSQNVAQIWEKPVGLLFVDGDHRYEAVRKDVDCWLPHVVAGGAIIFDDAQNANAGVGRVISELLECGACADGEKMGKMRQVVKL